MYTPGKSYSEQYPQGMRRQQDGKILAPRSLRKKGRKFLNDCTEKELRIIAKL